MSQSELLRSRRPYHPLPPGLPWFKISLLGVFLFSLALRFWGLGRFNGLVFDEVYYVKFAHNYLTQTPFFDGHPPLSKYLIAIAIWIGNALPIGRDAVNDWAGANYSTWSYRWLNALTGSFLPLVIAGIAYQLTRRSSYAVIAATLAAMDGMALVESRYALNNVYLVIFGLLGFLCLLRSLNSAGVYTRAGWMLGSGLFFGASFSVKWNGLWFLLGAYGLWILAWLGYGLKQFSQSADLLPQNLFPVQAIAAEHTQRSLHRPVPALNSGLNHSPLSRLTRLTLPQVLGYWGIVPLAFYYLSWLPHLRFNPAASFWQLQQQILAYHEQVGNGTNIHPYCANWYTWILMLRPVAYFYQITNSGAPLPTGKTPFPVAGDKIIYDVHSIGNPALWWLSTLAIALIVILLGQRLWNWATVWLSADKQGVQPMATFVLNPTELWLALFIVINYGANLLPWMRVTRCVFLYHYMGSSIFASLGIAWLCDRWLHSHEPRLRFMGMSTILLIFSAFLFWLPIYLGLPLSPLEFQLRMWLPSWI